MRTGRWYSSSEHYLDTLISRICERQPTHDSRQDMSHFSKRCSNSGALSRLRSITLSVQEQQPGNWEGDVTLFLLAPASPERFCTAIMDGHGPRLRRFFMHRTRMSLCHPPPTSASSVTSWSRRH